ncbi:MAG: dimethyl sulfoxide reductase anchor subunit [Boseongicola sp.]|nr:dimethyl sulfoxide reductase anchor subunit [Boseongicola sp.]NNJ69419.1 dimethyl sulfoxide reductase anchor subunit [Boseongicola sp.]
MHPAPSIIMFSTLSGLGFGLLTMLGLGFPEVSGWVAFIFFAIGFALAGGGLISATFHLGHPERALKSFTQWRSSWLSREAWAAAAAMAVMGLYAALIIFTDTRIAILGWIGAALSLLTVFTTSMIYTQLKTVPRWNHWSPPVLFMAYAIVGGLLMAGQVTVAVPLLVALGVLQVVAWVDQDRKENASDTTLATATGLGTIGTVKAFESPHTGGNYLTHEMAFRVARKHAQTLKIISVILAVVVPVILLLLPFHHLLALLAVVSHFAGVAAQRWLFFAEAKHVVSLYYGR